MNDMTDKDIADLKKSLNDLKSIPIDIRELKVSVKEIDVKLLNIMGDPKAPHSKGMIQTLQSEVNTLRADEIERLKKKVEEQDTKIKTFETLRDNVKGYIWGTAIGSGTASGGIVLAITKAFGG